MNPEASLEAQPRLQCHLLLAFQIPAGSKKPNWAREIFLTNLDKELNVASIHCDKRSLHLHHFLGIIRTSLAVVSKWTQQGDLWYFERFLRQADVWWTHQCLCQDTQAIRFPFMKYRRDWKFHLLDGNMGCTSKTAWHWNMLDFGFKIKGNKNTLTNQEAQSQGLSMQTCANIATYSTWLLHSRNA